MQIEAQTDCIMRKNNKSLLIFPLEAKFRVGFFSTYTLFKKLSKFPRYNMKFREKRGTAWNIPRSITFPRFILCYIEENRLPLMTVNLNKFCLKLHSFIYTVSTFYTRFSKDIFCFRFFEANFGGHPIVCTSVQKDSQMWCTSKESPKG